MAEQTDANHSETQAPGDRLVNQLAGDDFAAKVDAAHARRFVGSAIAVDTPSWNLVLAFREDVKTIHAELKA